MPGDGGRGEARQVGGGDLGRLAPSSGRSASAAGQPARAEHEGDVVALDAGQAGERVGGLLGLLLRGHGVSLGHP